MLVSRCILLSLNQKYSILSYIFNVIYQSAWCILTIDHFGFNDFRNIFWNLSNPSNCLRLCQGAVVHIKLVIKALLAYPLNIYEPTDYLPVR